MENFEAPGALRQSRSHRFTPRDMIVGFKAPSVIEFVVTIDCLVLRNGYIGPSMVSERDWGIVPLLTPSGNSLG